jgi:8-oxo-dGTP pyrophosphatase MutT (NUDIX family)
MRFGAGGLLVHDGCVLLGRRAATESDPLTWTALGGMAERGEDPLSCMVREVFEEGGIRVRREDARHLYLTGGYAGFEFHTYAVFLDRRVRPVPGNEMAEVAWFPLGNRPGTLWEAMPRPLHDGMAELVADRRTARTLFAWANEPSHRFGAGVLGASARTGY